jgi:hypothetical protein
MVDTSDLPTYIEKNNLPTLDLQRTKGHVQ